jgi:hypothetical protein
MGCDGGTIPKRDELVRKKKKPEQVSVSHLKRSCCDLVEGKGVHVKYLFHIYRKIRILSYHFVGNIAISHRNLFKLQL